MLFPQEALGTNATAEAVHQVYAVLERNITRSDARRKGVEGLASQSVVWTGAKFLPASSVVQTTHDYRPVLDYIPSSHEKYSLLYNTWKVSYSPEIQVCFFRNYLA